MLAIRHNVLLVSKAVPILFPFPSFIAAHIRCVWPGCYKLSGHFYTFMKHSDTNLCFSPFTFIELGWGGLKYLEGMASVENNQRLFHPCLLCCLLRTAPGQNQIPLILHPQKPQMALGTLTSRKYSGQETFLGATSSPALFPICVMCSKAEL